jgi:hypothetical protein
VTPVGDERLNSVSTVPNDFTSVDIWVGAFASSDALHAYMEERQAHFADETETVPISQLAEDMNAWFIDHDFECTMYVDEPTSDITMLLEESLIANGFGTQDGSGVGVPYMAARYVEQHGQPVNSIILVYGDEVQHPRSIDAQAYWLYYLGRFYETPMP